MVKMASEGTFLFEFSIFRWLFWNFRGFRFWHVPEIPEKGPETIKLYIFRSIWIFIEKGPKTIKIPTSGVFSKSLSVADRPNVMVEWKATEYVSEKNTAPQSQSS